MYIALEILPVTIPQKKYNKFQNNNIKYANSKHALSFMFYIVYSGGRTL